MRRTLIFAFLLVCNATAFLSDWSIALFAALFWTALLGIPLLILLALAAPRIAAALAWPAAALWATIGVSHAVVLLLVAGMNPLSGTATFALQALDALLAASLLVQVTREARLGLSHRLANGLAAAIAVLTAWSWATPAIMLFQAKVLRDAERTCILRPVGRATLEGYAEVASLFDLRGSELGAVFTGPTGSVVLSFHALMIDTADEDHPVWNWSLWQMRFVPLTTFRQYHIEPTCP